MARRQARLTSKLCIQPRAALDYVVNRHLRSRISDHDLLASEQGEMVSLGLHALVRNEFMCTAQLKSRMEAVNVTERLLGIYIRARREHFHYIHQFRDNFSFTCHIFHKDGARTIDTMSHSGQIDFRGFKIERLACEGRRA
ncbi:hypothetical protein AcW1_003293 [Taiwanofungus camphoratus]|nr:hypothetical protein AcV5_001523 [Antrodia cinnamomea]KAI0942739.1 hypothetical protein AcW1_003293 [Antrodia cinnamomea]